jgi:protein-L-isoaspartate O-methyltransferase
VTGGATAVPEIQALLRALDVAELGAAYGETAALVAETARSVVAVESSTPSAYEQLRGRLACAD